MVNVVRTPQPGDLGSGGTHKAGDREAQEVQVVDGRAQGEGCRGERLDRGDDRVGALGHGADRAEDDGGDKGDELAEEPHRCSWVKLDVGNFGFGKLESLVE